MDIEDFGSLCGEAPLERLRCCLNCGLLPSLLTQSTWEFDYNSMEFYGCVRRCFQFVCVVCGCYTPLMVDVHDSLSWWNEMMIDCIVDRVR